MCMYCESQSQLTDQVVHYLLNYQNIGYISYPVGGKRQIKIQIMTKIHSEDKTYSRCIRILNHLLKNQK